MTTPTPEVLDTRPIRRSAEAVTEGTPLDAYMGFCDTHDVPVREDMPEGTRATTQYRMITCFASGKTHQIQGERLHGLTTAMECDPSCRSARRQWCSCGCGGANHGRTWTRGKFIAAREVYEAAVIEMRKDRATRRNAAEKARVTRAATKQAKADKAWQEWLSDDKITFLVNWLTGPHARTGNFLAAMIAKVERHEILSENMIDACRNVYRDEQRKAATATASSAPPAARPGTTASDLDKLTPGVYKNDGHIYVVKGNKAYLAWRKATAQAVKAETATPARPADARVYAMELVESAPRMTEAGTEIPFELVMAKGVIWRLSLTDMMPRAEAEALSTKYRRCIVCGIRLKAAKSVREGIGPVCGSYFRD